VKFNRTAPDGEPLTPVEVYLDTDSYLFDEHVVMHDVEAILEIENVSLLDVARALVPLAFRLLCRAAFREDTRCNVRAADDR